MTEWEKDVAVCSWTLWGVAMVTVVCRMVSRRMALGSFKKYQLDDYLMLLIVVCYTGVVVTTNQVAINGSNYIPEGAEKQFTPKQFEQAEWGSKMLLALEEFMLPTLWLVKACLLLLYSRMTNGLKEGLAVKILGVYCAIGYITIQVLYLGVWCRPIYLYWAVPVPQGHEQCKSYHNHMITTTVFNISSDLAMLCIPVPLIARSHLPLKRKLVLCGVFSLGILVVLVAILNRYFNFTIANSLVFLNWYNGEASTAVMIANIPFCWTLLRKVFSLGAWSDTTKRGTSGVGPPTIGHAVRRDPGRVPGDTILGIEQDGSADDLTEKRSKDGKQQHELRSLGQSSDSTSQGRALGMEAEVEWDRPIS